MTYTYSPSRYHAACYLLHTGALTVVATFVCPLTRAPTALVWWRVVVYTISQHNEHNFIVVMRDCDVHMNNKKNNNYYLQHPTPKGLPEELTIARHAAQRRFALVTISSSDRASSKCWSVDTDLHSVALVLHEVLQKYKWTHVPLYAMGASSGMMVLCGVVRSWCPKCSVTSTPVPSTC